MNAALEPVSKPPLPTSARENLRLDDAATARLLEMFGDLRWCRSQPAIPGVRALRFVRADVAPGVRGDSGIVFEHGEL